MTFRALIDRAIQESLDDMAKLIERKLVAMFGEDAEPPARAKTTARSTRVSAKRSTTTSKATTRAKRTPRTATAVSAPQKPIREEATLRDGVLAALDVASAPMSRSQLIAALEIRPREEARFGTALVRLRADKLIVLEGLRRHATYRCATIGEAGVSLPPPEPTA
jgi:hypothetical protein